jgi:hypothetical protein
VGRTAHHRVHRDHRVFKISTAEQLTAESAENAEKSFLRYVCRAVGADLHVCAPAQADGDEGQELKRVSIAFFMRNKGTNAGWWDMGATVLRIVYGPEV